MADGILIKIRTVGLLNLQLLQDILLISSQLIMKKQLQGLVNNCISEMGHEF